MMPMNVFAWMINVLLVNKNKICDKDYIFVCKCSSIMVMSESEIEKGERFLNLFSTIIQPSLDVVGEPRKRHARCADKTQVVSDWLNPNSLGIMSAFSYIEYLA